MQKKLEIYKNQLDQTLFGTEADIPNHKTQITPVILCLTVKPRSKTDDMFNPYDKSKKEKVCKFYLPSTFLLSSEMSVLYIYCLDRTSIDVNSI